MRIRTAFVIVFTFLAIGIGAAGFLYYHHHKRFVIEGTLGDLAVIADLKGRDIAAWRTERISDANVLAMSPQVMTLFTPQGHHQGGENKTALADWLKTYRQSYRYAGVLIVNSSGKPVVSSPEGLSLPDHIKEHIFEAPREKPVFSHFHRTSAGKPFLSVYTAINLTPEAPPVGFLVLNIDPSIFLYPYIQLWPSPSPSGETILVERDGDYVVFLNEPRHQQGTALNLRIPLDKGDIPAAAAVLSDSGEMEGTDYRGVPVLAAFRAVPDSQWSVIAKMDRQEILAPLHENEILIGGLVSTLITCSGVTMLFLSRREEIRTYIKQQKVLEERDRARSELLEVTRFEELRFRQLAEAVPHIVWTATPDGKVDFLNSRWTEYTGMAVRNSIGDGWKNALHPADRERTEELWSRSLALGEPYEAEIRFRRNTDPYGWFLVRGLPMRDEGNNITQWFGTCTDITTIKKIEQEREMYIHTISHDLRTPLAAIQGFLNLSLLDVQDETLKSQLTAAVQGTERMNGMIQDLVDAARLEGGQLVLNLERIDLSRFIPEVLMNNAPVLGGTQVATDISRDVPPVMADKGRLERVLLNLITNAVKYSPPDAPVEVTVAAQDGGKVEIAVKDHGRGIVPEDLEHIFERFYLTRQGRKGGGVGLGLYITKMLVQAQGGSVEAESELAKGSIFRVILPASPATEDEMKKS